MNNSNDLPWSQPEQQIDPMIQSGEDDFSHLLDLDLDINFPAFDSNGDNAEHHAQSTEPDHNPHTPQQHQFHPNRASENAFEQQQFVQMQQNQQHIANGMRQQQHMQNTNVPAQSGNAFPTINSLPPYGQQQHAHPRQYHDPYGLPFQAQQLPQPYHHGVPPTPNSMDMHGETGKYLAGLDPQTRAAMERPYQLRNDDPMAFTPLVSPAVTPHETSFQLPPEFTVPGAYFSPLTSPMLEAQRNSQRAVTSNPRSTASPAATSPIDPDVEMAEASCEEPAKKLRKKISNPGPRAVANAARARQSPISKAQRKRGAISTLPSTKEASSIITDTQRPNAILARPSSAAGLNPGSAQDSSETESISPEPLSESVMPPPPKPSSKTQSPAILPQNQEPPSHPNKSLGSPATPASLMRIQQQQQRQQAVESNGAVDMDLQSQSSPEHFSLPEAAKTIRPQLPSIDTSLSPANDQATPRVSAKETPTSTHIRIGTPTAATAGASTKPSPRANALRSPGSSGGKPSRTSNKRNSTGSALVSPALRPKISPNIKPLLPEGATTTDDHHALLLASKSNYQNLLDGTRLPGVTYPQELSTNLTSKRTSHKIAEQGRRNRINTALQEMQSLLPAHTSSPTTADNTNQNGNNSSSTSPPAAAEAATPGAKGAAAAAAAGAQASNSKAATVESAIAYIKLLKQEAAEREREIAALKARLAGDGAMGGRSPSATAATTEGEGKNGGWEC